MWKMIGIPVLRCGAIYGVFGVLGILFYVGKWSLAATRRTEPQSNES